MSSDQKKSNGNPVITRLSVIIPIVVSIISLLFGAYQYLDKSELEKRLLQYEIRAKERNQADISVAYIETELKSADVRGGVGFHRVAQLLGEGSSIQCKIADSGNYPLCRSQRLTVSTRTQALCF